MRPNQKKRPVPLVDLHPVSKKLLRKGHPWVTADTYTQKFNRSAIWLLGKGPKGDEQFLLFHDPDHSKIKGRIWSQKKPLREQIHDFPRELEIRLQEAIDKRIELNLKEERDVFYLCFGEADYLPGLFVLLLKDGLLVQSYTSFWFKIQEKLGNSLRKVLKANGITANWAQYQERNHTRIGGGRTLWGKPPEEMTVTEFGVKYKLRPLQAYDFGLYPDMSAIRKELTPHLGAKKVLNLFSYTGAYSLYPLSLGAKEIVSVDLSGPYLNWLEDNIDLNPQLNGSHTALCMGVDKAIKTLQKEKKKFDLIISDPPTSSSDGKRVGQAYRDYSRRLKEFNKLLNPGGKLIIFLNTHNITRKKFNEYINKEIKESSFKWLKQLRMSEDCPTLQPFPEGDYLKGIILEKEK